MIYYSFNGLRIIDADNFQTLPITIAPFKSGPEWAGVDLNGYAVYFGHHAYGNDDLVKVPYRFFDNGDIVFDGEFLISLNSDENIRFVEEWSKYPQRFREISSWGETSLEEYVKNR